MCIELILRYRDQIIKKKHEYWQARPSKLLVLIPLHRCNLDSPLGSSKIRSSYSTPKNKKPTLISNKID